jgi:DNA end-binding protein Ku
MLHGKCGSRLKQQYICPVDNDIVERKDMVKGFEHSRDSYVQFTEEELKKLEAARTDSLDLIEFVPIDTIDFIYLEKTYYLGPDKGGERAYRLLSESLERTKKVAVGRFSTRGKDNLVVVRPYKKGLILHEVYYADEVRAFEDVETGGAFDFKPVEMDLADKLIEELSVRAFDPAKFKDNYAERVLEVVNQKVAGKEITVAPEAPKAQIIDLLEALKRSVANVQKGEAPVAANKTEPGEVRESERDVDGKGVKKATPRKGEGKRKSTGTGE